MTITQAPPKVGSLVGIADLDDEPACSDEGEIGKPVVLCPNPAHWQYRAKCGHPWLVCEHHHTEMTTRPGTIQCRCGDQTRLERLEWRHL